jgi:hypothetical protein
MYVMALITCPECQKKISESAETCPNCGFKLSSEKVKNIKEQDKENFRNGAIGCVVILIVFFLLYKTCGGNNNEYETPWQDKDESTMAYIMCQDWVKQRLVSPATADFPRYDQVTVTRNGQVYTIVGYVDSQNRFGALLRSNFYAEVEQIDKERWRCNKIEITE